MDAREKEIRDKIEALSIARMGSGSPEAMKTLFLSYDGNKDGRLNKDELYELLKDADIGSFITRGFYVDGIFERLDKSKDDQLTWEEYLAASSGPKPGPVSAPTSTPGPTPTPPAAEPICYGDCPQLPQPPIPSQPVCYGDCPDKPAAPQPKAGGALFVLGLAGLGLWMFGKK